MKSKKLIAIDKVPGELHAEIIRGLLEAQGIPAMLAQEGAARAIGLNIGPFGEVEILVPEEYEEQARQVLKDYEAGAFAELDENGDDVGDGREETEFEDD